jgi:hypothetical protein
LQQRSRGTEEKDGTYVSARELYVKDGGLHIALNAQTADIQRVGEELKFGRHRWRRNPVLERLP